MASGNAFQGMMKNQEDEMEKARKAAEASKAKNQQALSEAKQGQVAAAAGGYQTQAPPGPSAGGGNDANYKQMQDKFNASKNTAQSQLDTAANQQNKQLTEDAFSYGQPPGAAAQPVSTAANANNQALSSAVPAANNPQIPAQPMQTTSGTYPPAGDNEYYWDEETGTWKPVSGNPGPAEPTTAADETPLAPPGDFPPQDFIPGGVFTAGAGTNPPGEEVAPPSVGGTAINTGANAGIPAPIADPMYYQDEFIDPLIKKDILQRDNANFAGDTETHTASQVNMLDPSVTANTAGRSAQLEQLRLLGGMAGGEMSPVIQQQRDRGIQDTLAMMASQRGAPTSATMRTGMEGMSEVNRQATEAASQQQLQATQMLGEAGAQVRGQDFDVANAQASFQQQAGLSNAQMQNEMIQAEAQVNTQLEQQRDSMIASMTSLGVERDLAVLQVNAELGRLKEELLYKYWAGKLGASTQILGDIIEGTDTGSEDIFENVLEEGSVINLAGGYQTPEGYEVGGMQVTGPLGYQTHLGSSQDEPVDEDSPGWTLPENQPGADYGGGSTGGGTSGGGGGGSSGWYKDPVTGKWVTSGIEAKENVHGIGTSDEFYRKREATPFGQMDHIPTEFSNKISATDPTAMNNAGTTRLGDIKKGLVQDTQSRLIDASRETMQPKASDLFKTGAQDVADYLEYGNVGVTAAGLTSSDKEERKRAVKDLSMYGAKKSISKGIEETAKWLDDSSKKTVGETIGVEKAAEETAQIAGKATAQTMESAGKLGEAASAPITAAQVAPYVGGALQFGKSVLEGDQVGPSAIRAGGSLLGGLAGAGTASALGQAAATGAAMAATGGATSGAAIGSAVPGIGTAIGGLVGAAAGGIGAAAGGAAASPLADAATRRDKRLFAPRNLRDPGDLVGAPQAPGVYSGLETKRYIEDLTPVMSDMRYGSGNVPSDENSKTDIDPSKDELSDFLRELNPVKYDYKPEYGGEKNQYGIIAQDAQKTAVGESFVKENEDGTHMIDTGKATMVNMAALANQQKILDKQSKLIAQLLGER